MIKGKWAHHGRGVLESVLLLLTSVLVLSASSATYYIDPRDGDDNADGLSRATAWKHVVGARTGSLWGSDWVRRDFGSGTVVAGSKRLPPGTVLRIRSGTRIDEGAILISADFYESGTPEAPIVIERDSSWDTGSVILDASSMGLTRSESPLFIDRVSNIHISGAGRTDGLVVNNSPANGLGLRGSSGRSLVGIAVDNLRIVAMRGFGIAAEYLDGYKIAHVSIDGAGIAGNGGFHFGAGSCDNGVFSYCSASNLGDEPGAQRGGSDLHIGFWLVNARNVVYDHCTAQRNEGDGFDVGLYKATSVNVTDSIRYNNCTSAENADGFGMNAGEGLSKAMRVYCINSVAKNNRHAGFHAYGGTAEYTYVHCVSDGNRGTNFALGPDGWLDRQRVVTRIYNCVGYRPAGEGTFAGVNVLTSYIRGRSFRLESDNNYWRSPGSDGGGVFCYWDAFAGTNPYARKFTYENGPGSRSSSWFTSDDEGHAGNDANSISFWLRKSEPGFVGAAGNEYRLSALSPLLGKGADLSQKSWFIGEMGMDRDGKPRTSWDIGLYEGAVGGTVGVATATSSAMQPGDLAVPRSTAIPASAVRSRVFSLDGRTVRGAQNSIRENAVRSNGAFVIEQQGIRRDVGKRVFAR